MTQCDGLGSFGPSDTLRSDFLAIDRYVAGRFNPNADLIAVDLHNGDDDIVTDNDLLAQLPAQNQHGDLPVDLENFDSDLPWLIANDIYLK
jgi:hypothetical protein